MSWVNIVILGAAGVAAGGILAYLVVRFLGRREPYASFARLRLMRKVAFFRLLITDRRVPWLARLLPLLVVVYLVSPIDLIPGIAVDDVAFALLALVIIVRLTPKDLFAELIKTAEET